MDGWDSMGLDGIGWDWMDGWILLRSLVQLEHLAVLINDTVLALQYTVFLIFLYKYEDKDKQA